MLFTTKKSSLAIVAALLFSGGTASASAVITDWNLGNVSVSTATGAGVSTIYNGAVGNPGAVATGKVTFDGSEGFSPGIKIVNDDALTGSNGSNCIMANSGSSCNGAKQTGKRFKLQTTGEEPNDLVFNVNPDGSFASEGNDGLYKVFLAFGNDSGKSLEGFNVSLGAGVGGGFVASTATDGLGFVQSFGDDKPLNNSQFSVLFSNGLFGPQDDVHTLLGYFDDQRAGFGLAFDNADSFSSTGLFGSYGDLFGAMLSYDQLPQGYFFDDDGNADTDSVLIAHQLANGSWVQNRGIDGDGNIATLAFGNNGTAYASLSELIMALSAGGVQDCSVASSGTACLAGADAIDDLAKVNMSFFIDPTGYTDPQFTLRFGTALVSSNGVPEPGALALVTLGLGMLGATTRRKSAKPSKPSQLS